jgi:Flp pilus assembly protein TadD
MKRAVQDLEQVVSRHPEDTGALNDLAWFLIERQIDIDRGITLAKAAQVRRPRDPNILDTLGWGYYRKGDFVTAARLLEQAHAMDPADASIERHLNTVKAAIAKRPQ